MDVDPTPRKRTSPESITNKLREAEMLICLGTTVGKAEDLASF